MNHLDMNTSRRDFLKSSGLLLGTSASLHPFLSPSIARATTANTGSLPVAQPLETGWEFNRGSFGSPWEVWNLKVSGWHAVQLPHCFNHYDACDPDTPAYRGQGWYRTTIQPANPFPSGRTLLHFGGSGQRTSVFAGNTLMGHNTGGYNQFVIDITTAPTNAAGAISLAILCDNSRDPHAIPSDVSDFNLYGGIYRHLSLVYVPAIAVELVHVQTSVTPGQPAQCSVLARLHNPDSLTGPLDLSLTITAPDGSIVHAASQQLQPWQDLHSLAQFTISAPHLWSPASPSLYQCRLTLRSQYGEQTLAQRFGLRHFEFQEHGPFFLNGERLFLRGTHRHEDHAAYAAAVPDDITRQELCMIRDMGANFIRLAHYPQADLVLDLCDELGLIVWEELPWCRSGVGDAEMRSNARHLLSLMIEQHYNHPSIVFWSLGNEEDWPNIDPGDAQITVPEFMQELNSLAHRLDPSRYTSFRRCATAMDIPDVYSPSIWMGWYSGRYQDYEKSLENYRDQIRHLLHMEWGADSHARRHAEEPYGEPYPPFAPPSAAQPILPLVKHAEWSETYACDLFDWYLKTQETLPWFAGSAQWIFKDFSTPVRPENPIPRVNQKGLVERDLTFKEGYFVFQSYWASQPMVHIYGHTWPIRWGRPGQPRLVRVYSNCPSVELFLNGKSCGVKTRNSQDFPCAGLRWSIPFATGPNTLRAVAHANGASVTDEVHFTYQTTPWKAPAKFLLAEKSRTPHRITVEATLVDSHGTLCLDARNRVRFTIAGPGRLNDNLGTSTGSRVIELYNGRAEISITPGAQPSVVAVTSNGIQQALLTIG
jgi:beta-galactosidase